MARSSATPFVNRFSKHAARCSRCRRKLKYFDDRRFRFCIPGKKLFDERVAFEAMAMSLFGPSHRLWGKLIWTSRRKRGSRNLSTRNVDSSFASSVQQVTASRASSKTTRSSSRG